MKKGIFTLPHRSRGAVFQFFRMALSAIVGAVVANGTPEPIEPLNVPFEMPHPVRPVFPDRIFSIVDYGAVAGGEVLNRRAVQRAIDACHDAGGGTVRVPEGRWLTVPFELKSNVNLHLEKNAVLVFTDDKRFYFVSDIADHYWNYSQNSANFSEDPEEVLLIPRPLISAYRAENIAITGPGTLDGNGAGWWPLHRRFWERAGGNFPEGTGERAWRGLDPESSPGRPRMVQPAYSKNVLLEGFTALNGPHWMINPVACENVIIRRLTVYADDSPNTDGINPESSRNVLIEYCDIVTGDDSIAIKSGLDEAGRRRGLPCENVVIRHVNAVRIGIGSEMSGDVRNVVIRDSALSGSMAVLSIKTRRGRGGVVEDIWMENIEAGPVRMAILRLEMQYWTHMEDAPPEPVTERTPRIRNIHYRNIRCDHPEAAGAAVYVNGLPEMPIENLTFENVSTLSQKGIICQYANNVVFRNLRIRPVESPWITLEHSTNVRFEDVTVWGSGAVPRLRDRKSE